MIRHTVLFFFILWSVCMFFSCTSYKNVAYFKDFSDTAAHTSVTTVPFKSPVIQPDDLLTISMQTIDPDVNAVLNANAATAVSSGGPSPLSLPTTQYTPGYLVDKNGEVELPFSG